MGPTDQQGAIRASRPRYRIFRATGRRWRGIEMAVTRVASSAGIRRGLLGTSV